VRWVILSIVVSGCNFLGELPKDIYIEEAFSEQEAFLIRQAVYETNRDLLEPCLGFPGLVYQGRYEADFQLAEAAEKPEGIVYRLEADDPIVDYASEAVEYRIVGYATGHFLLIVPDKIRENGIKGITSHELGHYVGLSHNLDTVDALMSESRDVETRQFTDADRERFSMVHGCEYN
jgi:hypothetical protein